MSNSFAIFIKCHLTFFKDSSVTYIRMYGCGQMNFICHINELILSFMDTLPSESSRRFVCLDFCYYAAQLNEFTKKSTYFSLWTDKQPPKEVIENKFKAVPVHAMKQYMVSRNITQLILKLCTRSRSEISFTLGSLYSCYKRLFNLNYRKTGGFKRNSE